MKHGIAVTWDSGRVDPVYEGALKGAVEAAMMSALVALNDNLKKSKLQPVSFSIMHRDQSVLPVQVANAG